MNLTYDPRAMAAKERAFMRALAQRSNKDAWTIGLGRAALSVASVCAVLAWVLL